MLMIAVMILSFAARIEPDPYTEFLRPFGLSRPDAGQKAQPEKTDDRQKLQNRIRTLEDQLGESLQRETDMAAQGIRRLEEMKALMDDRDTYKAHMEAARDARDAEEQLRVAVERARHGTVAFLCFLSVAMAMLGLYAGYKLGCVRTRKRLMTE